MLLQVPASMNPLEQLRTAAAALPPGTLVTLSREALLDVLGGGGGDRVAGGDGSPPVAVDLTVTDLAQRFRRHPSTIRQWLESGRLEGYKLFGREWRVALASAAAFQDQQRHGRERGGSLARSAPSLGDWRKVT